ncbi:MAG: class I SAM-dependent methyltransferase [Bacteroidota bacterium]
MKNYFVRHRIKLFIILANYFFILLIYLISTMLNFANKVVRKIQKCRETAKRKKTNSAVLNALVNSENEQVKKIGNALRSVVHNEFSVAEIELFNKLEQFRQDRMKSTQLIQIEDFGAGNSESKRTAEEMSKGTVSSFTIGYLASSPSSRPAYARALYKIVEAFKFDNCIEMGTCIGISAAYQCFALQNNEKSRLVSIDGSPNLCEVSRGHLKSLGLSNFEIRAGRFVDVLPNLLNELKTVDYVFIDGHHDEKATYEYFIQLLPYLSDFSVLIFDDVNWSDGMVRAWKLIQKHEVFTAIIDVQKFGIGLIDKTSSKGVSVDAYNLTIEKNCLKKY